MTSYFDQSADAVFAGALAAQGQKGVYAQYAIQQAARYLQKNDYDAAMKEFRKALSFDPENETAHTWLGKIHLKQNRTREAIKEFKEVVRLQPLSVNALVNLGNAYIQDKNYAEAEKSLKKAAGLDPLNPVPDYTLGHLYVQTDRLDEAMAQFRKVQKVSPRDGNVYYSMGLVQNRQKNYEEAVKNLEKSLKLKPGFSSAIYELGIALDALGRKDEAEAQLKILRSKDPLLAKELQFTLEKPRIVAMDTSKSGGFVELMGAGTPLWALDPSLTTPGSSKEFSVTFIFSNSMDIASVTNPSNWSISRAKGGVAGYYNNTIPVTSRDAAPPPIPLSVTYNDVTREATVKFRLSQNAAGNATIDPSHLVFRFTGKDAQGRSMDVTGDEIDGFALKPF